jgi:hypothetical protein
MNKVILQLWEESERGFGTRPDGCSIHIDSDNRNNYIKSIYDSRKDEVPNIYDKIIGSELEAFIDDELFKKLNEEKSLRLIEPELNNLIKFEELIIK